MGKTSKSFRLPDSTVGKLKELSIYLKESETDVVERAIERLYSERDAVFQADVEERLKVRKAD